MFNLLLLPVLI